MYQVETGEEKDSKENVGFYHEESPSGVVEKDCGGEDEHCKTDEFVELE